MAKQLLVFCIVILSIALTCTAATLYTVGDNSGWDISTDLDTWAKDKKFIVGDALLFQYSSYHSVSEVSKESYDGCNTTTNVLQTSSNGNTTFPLSNPGDKYFVCGNRLHCLGGMKLHINIEDDDQAASSPAISPQADQESGGRSGGTPNSLPTTPSSKTNNPTTTSSSSSMFVHAGFDSLFLVLWLFLPLVM